MNITSTGVLPTKLGALVKEYQDFSLSEDNELLNAEQRENLIENFLKYGLTPYISVVGILNDMVSVCKAVKRVSNSSQMFLMEEFLSSKELLDERYTLINHRILTENLLESDQALVIDFCIMFDSFESIYLLDKRGFYE